MNYKDHTDLIKTNFPELDLLKDSEFHSFTNENFALNCVESLIELCNNASDKLQISLNFAVKYELTSNAQAIVKNNIGVILLNRGLINNLGLIVSDSIEIFCQENISELTINDNEKKQLRVLFSDLCFSYIFYHELAHILQFINSSSEKKYVFQEQYSSTFDIRNHVYEIDADNFGITMSMTKLFDYAQNKTYPINSMLLFNLLTAFVFCVSNIIIAFSKDNFNEIYYKRNSHPHPLIRIVRCNERILSFTSTNLNIKKEFFLAILQRAITIINQMQYSNNVQIDYWKLLQDNLSQIEIYNNEIETMNTTFNELIRFRVQKLFNLLQK